jgi:hypothetical protein
MANMQPGIFKARIVNYQISNNKKDNPQVEVLFEFVDGDGLSGTSHQIRWWGQLTEKAMPYTFKTLATLGYKGETQEDFYKLSDGVEGGMLDLGVEVELVLENETKDDGKTFVKIKYINAANRGFKNGMTRAEAKVKLGALNIAGQMALARQELGIKNEPKRPVSPAAKVNETDLDDLPF